VTRATTIRDDTTARHVAKYANRNPLHRLALGRFLDHMAAELRELAPRTVLEFGCGEGLLLQALEERGVHLSNYTGIDLRADAIDDARALHPRHRFEHADLFEWPGIPGGYDLVVASQVLEHLPEPAPALERLAALAGGRLLLSVPDEPWFRLLNLLRGRDLARLGNHPEHVNLWSASAFRAFVEGLVQPERTRVVFPFTVVVAHPRER
jgi:2-polyprenyl-3-methyl-5-hydroxy-6-metoxy-1,4-benzoquinol methylase